jgi:membrane protease subunit HflC
MNRTAAIRTLLVSIAMLLLLVLGFAFSMFFVVDAREYAIVSRFGMIRRVISDPGMQVKWPAPFEYLTRLDRRLHVIEDQNKGRRYVQNTQQPYIIYLSGQWRISDPRQYFLAQHQSKIISNQDNAFEARLWKIMHDAFEEQLASQAIILPDGAMGRMPNTLMQAARIRATQAAQTLGIEIVEMHISGIELPEENQQAAIDRMVSDVTQALSTLRISGMTQVEQIRAQTDSAREEILARAYEQARTIKGEGEARAIAIEAKAFKRHPAFYRFYKKLPTNQCRQQNENNMLANDLCHLFSDMQTSPNSADH